MNKKTEDVIIFSAVVATLVIFVMLLFCPKKLDFVYWLKNLDFFSCEQAERAAQQYLEKNHPDSDYEIRSSSYNDKDERYYVSIASPGSADRNFQLGYDGKGVLTYNSYDSLVAKRGNVAIRLNSEYDAAMDEALQSTQSLDLTCAASLLWTSSYTPHDNPHRLYSAELELDASYDLTEFGKKYGSVWVNVEVNSAEAVTVENLAEILLYLRETVEQAGLPFYMIDCYLDYPNGTYSRRLVVKDFLYEDIYEENLEARLEEVLNQ